jgi:hypothetical protein
MTGSLLALISIAMDKVSYLIDNPHILVTRIPIEENQHLRMINSVLAQKDKANYHGGYTFEIEDPFYDFSFLYNRFLKITDHVFGPLNYSVKHKHWCWANVYNCESNITNMHDHQKTSTINSVFYLNIPADMENGGLEIFNNGKIEVFYPETFDLIIMPSWMPHQPCDHNSKEYRIAINMEISTIETTDEIYTLEKIFARCSHA